MALTVKVSMSQYRLRFTSTSFDWVFNERERVIMSALKVQCRTVKRLRLLPGAMPYCA